MDNSDVLPYDITLSMFTYLFLSKVATLTKQFTLSHISMCISILQLVRNIDIAVFADKAVFAGIAVFAHLRRLNVITSRKYSYDGPDGLSI